MGLEESEAPALAIELLHLLLKLQQQRELLVCDGLEPRHVQPPNLAGGDAEDLTQRGIGDVRYVIMRTNHPPEFQLDQVIYLSV